MNKKLSFILDGTPIYTDTCLVRDEIPIFFTCVDDMGRYYVALCVDMDLPQYNVVKVSTTQLNNMLQGIFSMRELFIFQDSYWEVKPVDDKIENDSVSLKLMENMDLDELPDEDAYFELFSDELKEYAKEINKKICEGDFNSLSMDICEISDDISWASEVSISVSLNSISIKVETCDKTEYEKEESCLVENRNYSINDKNVLADKILVRNVKEDSSLKAA